MNERDLFLKALDITDPAERAALLDRECAGNADLRQGVEALLAADAAAGGFLEQPHPAAGQGDRTGAFVGAGDNQAADLVGSVIAGKYKLLQLIGEGGMGAVYMADQTEPIKRRVAVKLIRTERGNSKTILSRFEAERQAIALMDHPHIAKLLDAGTIEETQAQGRPSLGFGCPYFVMELVKGIPLTQYCDEHRLSILDRLNLFQQICSAVQHAHQKGIIHRDLKPGNILVESHDDKPVPKVIDFGLAKATSGIQLSEHTLFTALGTVAGTPLYMAPEQAKFNAIDVDTRADIYALGVILYELLTGTTPIERETFKKAAFDEILRVVREQEPPTPSKRLSSTNSTPSVAANRQMEPLKLGRFVKGELDWIVMKALSKERDRRYETANGFAKDIERFLNHEPVQAGPPSAGYKLRKFVQRNRPQVIAASLVLLTLVAGIAGTTLGLLEARKQERLASDRADAETKERRRADAETQKVQATLVVVGERTKLAQDAFADMVFDMQTLLETRPGTQDLRRALLEKARQGLAKILDEARKQGTPDSTLVWSHLRMGDVEENLGNSFAAQKKYQAGYELAQKLADADPKNAQAQRDLSVSFERLGNVALRLGQTKDALDFYKKLNAIAQKFADADSKNAQAQRDLGVSFERLGDVTSRLGQTKDTLDFYRKSNEIAQKLDDADPKNAQALRNLSVSFERLGDVTSRLGQTEDSLDFYRKYNELAQRLADANPKNVQAQRDLGVSYDRLGDVTMRLGQTKDALDFYRKSLDVGQRLADADPKNAQAQRDLGVSYDRLGDVTMRLGRTKDALDFYRKSLDMGQRLADADPKNAQAQRDLSISFNKLGGVTLRLGQTKDALDFYRKSLDVRQRLANADPKNAQAQRDLGVSYDRLGDVTRELGQTKDALDFYKKCSTIFQRLADADPKNAEAQMDLFISFCKLGVGEMANQEHAEAATWLGKAEQALMDFQTKGWITKPEQLLGTWSVRQWQTDIARRLTTCRNAEKAIVDLEFALKQPAAEVPGLLDIRAQVFAKKNDRNNLVATATAYEKLATTDDHHCYNAACAWSLASGVAKDDAKLREEYASKVMTLLRKTPTGKGYFVDSPAKLAAHMKQDADLDSLRGREDFKKLLAEMEMKK